MILAVTNAIYATASVETWKIQAVTGFERVPRDTGATLSFVMCPHGCIYFTTL